MQMVFQTPTESFAPRCRLGDAVAESLRNAGMPKKEAMEIVNELFKQCGLPENFLKRYPHEVSGGQCQRAAIARAIAPSAISVRSEISARQERTVLIVFSSNLMISSHIYSSVSIWAIF